MQFLAISGSLRAQSANTALLQRIASIVQPPLTVCLWNGLADIPPFHPDMAESLPVPIADLRAAILASSALLISSPEYAHGVAGVMKNALDWLVGTDALHEKTIALINVSSRATIAQAALAETLRTMGARVIDVAMPGTIDSIADGAIDQSLMTLMSELAFPAA